MHKLEREIIHVSIPDNAIMCLRAKTSHKSIWRISLECITTVSHVSTLYYYYACENIIGHSQTFSQSSFNSTILGGRDRRPKFAPPSRQNAIYRSSRRTLVLARRGGGGALDGMRFRSFGERRRNMPFS